MGCDHLGPPMRTNNKPTDSSATFHGGTNRSTEPWKDGTCGKCGARRIDSQLGLERTPEEFIANMVAVFREVWRVLKPDGTIWVNLGSSYASGDTNANQSRQLSHVPACGNGGRALQDSMASDYVCSCLCDGCQVVLGLSHSENICQLHGQSLLPVCKTNRGSVRSDFSSVIASVSLGVVQESTKPESLQQPRVVCLHCANCGACLSVLGSSSRDARLCVRSSWVNNTIVQARFKPKDMVPTPWMLAMALQADGWYLRSDIIWHKPNPMPESVTDRPTKSHEYVFLLSKSVRYFYDQDAIREPQMESSLDRLTYGWNGNKQRDWPKENQHNNFDRYMGKTAEEIAALPGRNKRSVWTIPSQPWSGPHFATFPEALVEPCILAGSRPGDLVLDPFVGSGTVIRVATRHQRKGVGTDLNLAYLREQASKRTRNVQVQMAY